MRGIAVDRPMRMSLRPASEKYLGAYRQIYVYAFDTGAGCSASRLRRHNRLEMGRLGSAPDRIYVAKWIT
jgi:hypothetical protein